MNVRHKTFSGGYRFRNFEGQPQEKLVEIKIPERVVILLKQGFGIEVLPIVKTGDRVKAGQIIARDDNSVSSPIHSSVNGVVEEITKKNYFQQEVNAVVIKTDATNEWEPLEGYTSDWGKLPVEKIEELLYLSGVSSLGREGIPTRFNSSTISPGEVENVIINGVGSEVYNSSLSVLLGGDKTLHFADSLRILKTVMPNAHFHAAFNTDHKDVIERISGLLDGDEWIDFYALDLKYPQGFDEVLVSTILDKKMPGGGSAAAIGVVVLNVQAALQAHEAVTTGKPLIERTVALCGQGFTANPHITVRIGTPLEHIVQGRIKETMDIRFMINSPLTGPTVPDLSLPVDSVFSRIIALPEQKTKEFLALMNPGFNKDSYSNTFLSFLFKSKKYADTNLHGEERPCVFCNFCQEVCPVSLIPHLLYHYVERGRIDEVLTRLKIFDCLDCNLCTYVCPSKIPVAAVIKDGKEQLRGQSSIFACIERQLTASDFSA